MPDEPEHDLPDRATALIALARVAHREGNRGLERSALDKLSRDFGMTVSFPCCESVTREIAASARTGETVNA